MLAKVTVFCVYHEAKPFYFFWHTGRQRANKINGKWKQKTIHRREQDQHKKKTDKTKCKIKHSEFIYSDNHIHIGPSQSSVWSAQNEYFYCWLMCERKTNSMNGHIEWKTHQIEIFFCKHVYLSSCLLFYAPHERSFLLILAARSSWPLSLWLPFR